MPNQLAEPTHAKKKVRTSLSEDDQEVLNIYAQEMRKLKALHAIHKLSDFDFAQKLRALGDPTVELFKGTGITLGSLAESIDIPSQVISKLHQLKGPQF